MSLSQEEMYRSIVMFLVVTFRKHLWSIYYLLGSMGGTGNTETEIYSHWLQGTHILVERKTSTQIFKNMWLVLRWSHTNPVGRGVGGRIKGLGEEDVLGKS